MFIVVIIAFGIGQKNNVVLSCGNIEPECVFIGPQNVWGVTEAAA